MKYLKDFIKGLIIGISNVIPGFSGGTMAVILGEYERVITAFSKIAKHPIQVIKDLWAMVIGMALGIILTSYTIILALENFPFPTVMLFVGMVLGSVPLIVKNIKNYGIDKDTNKFKVNAFDIIGFIICASIIVILPLLNQNSTTRDLNLVNGIIVFIMGIISAGAMIVPGLSGVLILMIFGYYFLIIGDIKNVVSSILTLNFTGFGLNLLTLIIFAVGAVIGLVFISKLIRLGLNKCPKTIYFCILGFLLASPFSMIYSTNKEYVDPNFDKPLNYIIAFLLFALGAVGTYLLTKVDKSNKKENIDESKNTENKA